MRRWPVPSPLTSWPPWRPWPAAVVRRRDITRYEEVASPLTPDQLAALAPLARRCGEEEGHHQV
jgi:hypothetical protein